MRTKLLIVVTAFSLMAAACGSEAPVVERSFGVVDQGDQGHLQVLAYDYQPDSSLGYSLVMDMTMNATADFPGSGGAGDMSMGMSMGGDIEYEIAPGAQAGSVELTMRSNLSAFDLNHFTVDGQSMANQLTSDDLAVLSDQSALPEITVVVDQSGEVLELRYGDAAMPTDFLGGFGSGGFSDPTGMSLTGMFGPEMPAEEVRVGAQWTVDSSQEIPLMGTLDSSTHYWITGEEQFNGHDVLVIVSQTTIEDIELDLLEMMQDMLEMDSASLAAMGMGADEMAQMQSELFAEIDMAMHFSYDDLSTTTYFDPAEGIVVWTATEAHMTGAVDMDTPDGSGTMAFDMLIDMKMTLADDGIGA